MKEDPSFVILKPAAWLDASEFEEEILGAIVQEFLKPTDNYVPKSPLQYNSEKFVEGPFTDFTLKTSGSAAQGAGISLGSILGFNLKGSAEDAVHLNGKRIRHKQLQQHSQFWDKLKQDPVVKSIVPGWISFFNRRPVCLVVGIMICEDIDVSFKEKRGQEADGHLEIPIAQAAGVPIPLGNPQAKMAIKKNKAATFKGKSGQSKIFALQLKKVTTGMLRKRNELDLNRLGPRVGTPRLCGAVEFELVGVGEDGKEEPFSPQPFDPQPFSPEVFAKKPELEEIRPEVVSAKKPVSVDDLELEEISSEEFAKMGLKCDVQKSRKEFWGTKSMCVCLVVFSVLLFLCTKTLY